MRVKIYVEGGGNNSDTQVRCRQGFAEYCQKLAPSDRRPKIIACGGRQQAFNRFKTDFERNNPDERCALLVDSEGPISGHFSAVEHLRIRDGWNFNGLPSDHVFLMVQAMEAWFLADRNSLAIYYGSGFRLNVLPGNEHQVEIIAKANLEQSLESASRNTQKGEYHKTRHAFAILEVILPDKVEHASPHAARFHKFLREL